MKSREYVSQETYMRVDRLERDHTSLAVLPSSYEELVAKPDKLRVGFTASPLAVAELFDWEEEDDD